MDPHERLASILLFSGARDLTATLAEVGLTYRKGKTIDNVRTAIPRGVEDGRGKIELAGVAARLKTVLRKT